MTKNLLTLLIAVCLTTSAFAQAPEMLNYQAVVRDDVGDILANQAVSFRISILETSTTGTAVFAETHSVSTNDFGLVTLAIGGGSLVSGNFSTINWGSDLHFVQIELDEAGGSNYTLLGTSQLLSVPYALHAKSADSVGTETDPVFGASIAAGITGSDTTYWNNKLDAEVDGSLTNEIQALSISNDTIFLVNGGFVKLPPNNTALATGVVFRTGLPQGANCPSGGNYDAPSSTLQPGIYLYTLYSCAGQLGTSGGDGFSVDIAFLTGSGDSGGTYHDFSFGSCGTFYTGVVRVATPSTVSVRYTSNLGSSFTVPGPVAERVDYYKIY